MSSPISGIHHITGAVTKPQRDYDFYTQTLGLRMIKQTVNHESPNMWHFFYGDYAGNPGTVMTNIIFDGIPLPRCKPGRGSISALAYSVPKSSLGFWRDRLTGAGYRCEDRGERFGETVLYFEDPEGLPSELIGCGDDREPGAWNGVPQHSTVRGFHSATIVSRLHELSVEFFTMLLGFDVIASENDRIRLSVNGGGPGTYIDLVKVEDGPWARFGLGAIHHVALTVADIETMHRMWGKLSGAGLILTDLRDRKWFHSTYFTEPGGINLEISNVTPGFTVDEPLAELGTTLQLPKQWEAQRGQIESVLPKMDFRQPAMASS